VIVVSWNTRELLRGCLLSIRRHLSATAHEIIVIDNASSDGSAEMVEAEFPEALVIRNAENIGFGAANNLAMSAARGEYFLLLNSDAELLDDGPARLASRLDANREIGVAGLRIVRPGGGLQASARRFPTLQRIALVNFWLYRLLSRRRAADVLLGHYWEHDSEREADWVIGACMLVRRDVFQQTGGFDRSIFLYGEEVEWCHRIRERGWKILFAPVGRVLHLDHQSADRLLGTAGRVDRCLVAEDRLVERWQGRFAARLVPLVRVAGAMLRLVVFSLRGAFGRDDEYGRDVRTEALGLLDHYRRRWRGTVGGRASIS
jgi:GT2 family glycosyltransferase